MQKLLLICLISLVIVAQARLGGKDKLIGGWEEYDMTENSDYKLDQTLPLNIAYRNISELLSKRDITNINFYHVKSQLVNGINYKIQFSYEQGGQKKIGSIGVYIQPWTGTFRFTSISLQDNKDLPHLIGGYEEYEIEEGYEFNQESPLYLAYQRLIQKLAERKIKFIRFDHLHKRIYGDYINFSINFTYRQDGEEKQGYCTAYIKPEEKFVKIFSLKVDESSSEEEQNIDLTSENENKHSNGGWEEIEFDESQLSDSQSPLSHAHNELQKNIKSKGFRIQKILKINQQIVSGVNYRIRFQYRSVDGVRIGEAVIYVQPWTNTIQIKSLNLDIQSNNI